MKPVFICYAREDRDRVVLPLRDLLVDQGLNVWLDRADIRSGAGWRERLEEALAVPSLCIIVVSHYFLAKPWTIAELGAVFARELEYHNTLIPLWHDINLNDVKAQSPLLRDRIELNTATGLELIANQVIGVLREKSTSMPILIGEGEELSSAHVVSPMSQSLLDSFERLTPSAKAETVWEILKRSVDLELPDLSEESLLQSANDVFLRLEAEESERA